MQADDSDWQLTKQDIKDRCAFVYKNKQWTDCSFVVGFDDKKLTFEGHKIILAMASPVFEKMFFGALAKNEPVIVTDIPPDVFSSLLEYIYTNKITIRTLDFACEVCYAAKKYMMPDLVKQSIRRNFTDLCAANACKAYEFATFFEEPVLLEQSLQIIKEKTKEVLYDPSFEDVDLSTILMIFSLNDLKISSELDLFDALHRWAIKECGRRELEVDHTNMRKVIENALDLIRFLSLTPQQFATGPALSQLLTDKESLQILMTLVSPSSTEIPSAMKMPVHFSKDPARKKPVYVWKSKEKFFCRRGCIRPFSTPTEWYENTLIEANLRFSVDRDIQVIGITVLFRDFKESILVSIFNSNDCRLACKRYDYELSSPNNAILFDSEVDIEQHVTYKIVVMFYERKFDDVVPDSSPSTVEENGVTFYFPYVDVDINSDLVGDIHFRFK